MILLQNPNIPTQVNAVEIDKAIVDINAELNTRLSWITHAYGRAYKNLDITNGSRVYFPEVYLGKQNGSYRYANISPDNDKTGQCFFIVRRETISQYQQGMYNFLNYDVSIIFSVNMELINATLTETDIYQQVLVSQVRDVLTRQILGKNYNIVLNNIEYLFEDVFRDFELTEQSTMEKSPLSHFRVNMSLSIPEACPVPTLTPICKSLFFDGVNEDIFVGNQSAFDFEWTQPISIEAWILPTTDLTLNFAVTKWRGGATAKGWFFAVLNNNPASLVPRRLRMQFRNNTSGTYIDCFSNQEILLGQWNHVVMTYDGSGTIAGIDFYINNAATSKPHYTPTASQSGPLSGGTIRTGEDVTVNSLTENVPVGTYVGAGLELFRMWNVQLSASEVNTLYNKQSVPQTPALIMNSDITNSIFISDEWQIPDLSTVTSGYLTRNMEEDDLQNNCSE